MLHVDLGQLSWHIAVENYEFKVGEELGIVITIELKRKLESCWVHPGYYRVRSFDQLAYNPLPACCVEDHRHQVA